MEGREGRGRGEWGHTGPPEYLQFSPRLTYLLAQATGINHSAPAAGPVKDYQGYKLYLCSQEPVFPPLASKKSLNFVFVSSQKKKKKNHFLSPCYV